MRLLIGLDLGGSSVKGVAVREDGSLLGQSNLEFDPNQRLEWAENARKMLAEFEAKLGPVDRVGVSAPGLAAANGRAIAYMPGRLQGLEGFDWTRELGRKEPVPVLNDAHAALLGETWVGAAQGARNAIMLTLGTGVGGAAMVDGHLLKGAIGRAGHLGHNCLAIDGVPDITRMPGSIEVLIGNCTIRERTEGRFETTHDLVKAYAAGDQFAAKVWLDSVRALGCAVGSFINLFDPATVIIGGGVARAGKLLFEPLERVVREVEWQPGGVTVPIVAAKLGELAGAFGAARNGLEASGVA